VAENLSSRDGKIVGIARGDMRRIFAEGCKDYIEWGKNVTGYELTDDGVRAIFSDGTKSIEGSMLVGGEGIYSKVARQVSGGKLKVYDTGARGIHGQAPTTAFKQLGEGVFRLRDDTRPDGHAFLMTNVRSRDMNNPDVSFGWTMGGAPGVIRAPNDNYAIVGKVAADIAKSIAKDWDPKFKALIDNMDEGEAAFWKITCSTPSGVPEWKNEPRVTVIGDAAHSMTPAGGIGANTAVRDSALLGRLLREAGGYSPGVTAAYEKEMRVYASDAVHQSYSMAVQGFGINIDEETTPVV
jgi:2-polyprenyl-6-methoxyphenol hydroxylase-like FAD-dependent oxidoreductase